MPLSYSPSASQASSLFNTYRNDIDIFTEDKPEDKEFYTTLFKRLLEGTGININDTYPCGSYKEVYDKCQNDIDKSRKKIYIVDGDIFLLFKPKIPLPNMYVIDAYCIENLIFDEKGICTVIHNDIGSKTYEEIKSIYDFSGLINDHQDELIELFYHKALDRKFRGYFTLKNIDQYYTTNHLDPVKILSEKDEIKANLIDNNFATKDDIDRELNQMRQIHPICQNTFLRIISGKDFLIEMSKKQAKKKFGRKPSMTREGYKLQLAQNCDLTRLQPLKDAILNAYNCNPIQ